MTASGIPPAVGEIVVNQELIKAIVGDSPKAAIDTVFMVQVQFQGPQPI